MTKTKTTMTYKQKWLKPLIGIALVLLVITPLVIWELTQNGKKGIIVSGMTVTGLFLGYTLSRSKFGFNGPIKKIVQQGDGRQMKALIYLFMIASVIAGAAIIGLTRGPFHYPLGMPLGVGTIVGGILFGSGMVLATGCASGTLSDIGDGAVPAIVVLVFFMIGSALGVNFYGTSADISFTSGDTSISNLVGSVSLGLIINLALLGLILGTVVIYHKWKASKGTLILTPLEEKNAIVGDAEISPEKLTLKGFFSYTTWMKMFEKRWTWMMGVFMIALWYGIIVLAFKETPGITGAYARWGIVITHGFGSTKALEWGPLHNGTFDVMQDSQSWQNVGIIVGAFSAKLFANKFSFEGIKNQKWFNWVLYALGGLLMGLGARLARGCNFGALFTGVTFQTGFGWVFGIFLFASAAATALFTKKIHHETPPWVYKQKK